MRKKISEQNQTDYNEKWITENIGRRIREIRTARGLSQAELGKLVGLNAGRIQKYENGQKSLTAEMLIKIAIALKVSPLALTSSTNYSIVSAMFAMFEIGNRFNMKIEKIDNKMCLTSTRGDSIYGYMEKWYNEYSRFQEELSAASSEKEESELLKKYRFWEWEFPKPVADKTQRELAKLSLKNKN